MNKEAIRAQKYQYVIQMHLENLDLSVSELAKICNISVSNVNFIITKYYKSKIASVKSRVEIERKLPPCIARSAMSSNEDDYAINMNGFRNIKWSLENLDLTTENEDGSRPICVGDLIKNQEL